MSTAIADDGLHPTSTVPRLRVFLLLPFIGIHVGALLAPLSGFSWAALTTALALYFVRMFAITAFYHRYFSHRSFTTSRGMQFLMAVLGNSAAQRGPLWWAAHHRLHHRHSDTSADTHSPVTDSLWHSHIGWIVQPHNYATNYAMVQDWCRYPELRWLDRHDYLAPLLLAAGCYGFGAGLAWWWPNSGTSGIQMLLWGFCLSTTLCYHATFSINSLAHLWGTRPYATKDHSRNNALLALLTLGEGWHNNHHRFPASARQGFRWWEIDCSYYALRGMALVGLVSKLRPVPQRILAEPTASHGHALPGEKRS
ncbi:MAG: acyl-CoA desaturase [Planctomycetota bacterium]|nr:MAG: acyl-CoA desaturase [Planctomycetota bacterium]